MVKAVSVIAQLATRHFRERGDKNVELQELLYDASYHALKGNSDPLNAILSAAQSDKTFALRGLTMWVEFNLPVRVKDEKFKLNKGWTASEVADEAEFDRVVLPKLRASAKFWELQPKQKAQSVWELDRYLNSVFDTLVKHGREDIAKEIMGIKAHVASAPAPATVQ